MAKQKIQGILEEDQVITENSTQAKELYDKNRYGALQADGRVKLSLLEALYLVEKKKLEVLDKRGKVIPEEKLSKKPKKSKFNIRYAVFKSLRDRGYTVKTALKFGADFRAYEKGVKPGQDHAKWIVYAVHESESQMWHEFAAKNRVAHSTKKKLLIGVVDDEGDVSYWEVRWFRP